MPVPVKYVRTKKNQNLAVCIINECTGTILNKFTRINGIKRNSTRDSVTTINFSGIPYSGIVNSLTINVHQNKY